MAPRKSPASVPAPEPQIYDFQIDLQGLIKLLAKNLYAEADVFVREMLQNAHDSVKRRRELQGNGAPPGEIRVRVDRTAGTITFTDNGSGMTEQEVKEYLSTIGRSGTDAFRQDLLKQGRNMTDVTVIGQFGIGLLSAFIVADRVVVETQSWQSGHPAWRWESCGEKTCELRAGERSDPGSTVTLYITENYLWAKFVRGVIDSPALTLTAARDAVQQDAIQKEIKEQLGEAIIAHLTGLSKSDPDKFQRLCDWHHYHLKGMALRDDTFFQSVSDLIPFETNQGPMSLKRYFEEAKRLGQSEIDLLYFDERGSATQFYMLCEARGLLVVDASQVFEDAFLERYGRLNPQIKLRQLNIGESDFIFEPLPPEEHDEFRLLETEFSRNMPDRRSVAKVVDRQISLMAQEQQQNQQESESQIQALQDRLAKAEVPQTDHVSCFFAMPFAEDYNPLLAAVRHVLQEKPYGWEVTRADSEHISDTIPENVREHIARSHCYLAEVSDGNPNVFLEIGRMSHYRDRGRPLIYLCKIGANPPIDIAGDLLSYYDPSLSPAELINQIRTELEKKNSIRGLRSVGEKAFLSAEILENIGELKDKVSRSVAECYKTVGAFCKADPAAVAHQVSGGKGVGAIEDAQKNIAEYFEFAADDKLPETDGGR